MQMFRMREYVRIGTPEQVTAFRAMWLERAEKFVAALALPAHLDVANDPVLRPRRAHAGVEPARPEAEVRDADPDRERREADGLPQLQLPPGPFRRPVGHRDRGRRASAHTACVGFGMERIALALFKHHGLHVDLWPAAVRDTLWAYANARPLAARRLPRPRCADVPSASPAQRPRATGRRPIATWISGSSSCTRSAASRVRRSASRSAQDFEGDHFTFSKFPSEDLNLLYSVRVQELAIYDSLEGHLATQIERGRMPIVEVDGFFLPDTRGTSYRRDAPRRRRSPSTCSIRPARRRRLFSQRRILFPRVATDYDGLLIDAGRRRRRPCYPYADFVKFGCHDDVGDLRAAARALLCKHVGERPTANPVAAFRSRIGEQAYAIAQKSPECVSRIRVQHAAPARRQFRTAGEPSRLARRRHEPLRRRRARVPSALSSGAKSFQFQLARAIARKRFDGLAAHLDPLVAHYDRALDLVSHTDRRVERGQEANDVSWLAHAAAPLLAMQRCEPGSRPARISIVLVRRSQRMQLASW